MDEPSAPLIIGAGYVGGRVAHAWRREFGGRVFVTTRGRRKSIATDRPEMSLLQINVHDRRTLRHLTPEVVTDRTPVLIAVSHDRSSGRSPSATHVDGLRHVLDRLDQIGRTPPITLISTTGVYHQRGGVWVDERSPTRPTRPSSIAHLRGEALLRRRWSAAGRSATVLRLAGIYGPGRLPNVRDVRRGQVAVADPDSHLNLIHVDDAVAACLRSMRRPGTRSRSNTNDLFCIADGHPVRRRVFYDAVAAALRCEPPQYVAPPSPRSPRSIGGGDRRIRNRKLRRELLRDLSHPRAVDSVGPLVTADRDRRL